jgi:hypothetical protein
MYDILYSDFELIKKTFFFGRGCGVELVLFVLSHSMQYFSMFAEVKSKNSICLSVYTFLRFGGNGTGVLLCLQN